MTYDHRRLMTAREILDELKRSGILAVHRCDRCGAPLNADGVDFVERHPSGHETRLCGRCFFPHCDCPDPYWVHEDEHGVLRHDDCGLRVKP